MTRSRSPSSPSTTRCSRRRRRTRSPVPAPQQREDRDAAGCDRDDALRVGDRGRHCAQVSRWRPPPAAPAGALRAARADPSGEDRQERALVFSWWFSPGTRSIETWIFAATSSVTPVTGHFGVDRLARFVSVDHVGGLRRLAPRRHAHVDFHVGLGEFARRFRPSTMKVGLLPPLMWLSAGSRFQFGQPTLTPSARCRGARSRSELAGARP